jgi:hypothetical protein
LVYCGIIATGVTALPLISDCVEKHMNEQNITLSLNLVNGVLQYLGTRPYGEVFQLVQAIQEQAIPQIKVPEVAEPEVVGGTD